MSFFGVGYRLSEHYYWVQAVSFKLDGGIEIESNGMSDGESFGEV